jgi:hypothetical protein
LSETKRWVLISPPGAEGCHLLLAEAANEEQQGSVFLFLHTDNFQVDFDNLKKNKVRIVREASKEEYGTVAVFADLYGNLRDLIEPKKGTS